MGMIELAITIDDPNLGESPLLSAEARDEHIRLALKGCNSLKARKTNQVFVSS
jgi:hypothetical protein